MQRIPAGTFHGAILATRKLRGLEIVVAERPGVLSVGPHIHELPCLITLLSGDHTYRDDAGKTRASRRGAWYYRPPNSVQRHLPQPTSIRSLAIEFDPDLVGIDDLPAEEQIIDSPPALMLSERIAVELFRGGVASDLALSAHALNLLALLLREGRPVTTLELPSWLLDVREMLHERFTQRVTLEELANEAGVHPAHLSKAFRQAYGIPFSDYLLELRLAFAREALQSTNLKIADIAAESGFSDHAHLSRHFKRRYGVSPGEWREPTEDVTP